MTALRALLAGLVDYAGLFPPAALNMPSAVRQYADYAASDQAWMLGRFVVPAAHLDAFRDAHAALRDQPEWHLSALVGADVEADIERVRSFNDAMTARARIDTIEGKATTDGAVARIADCASGFRAFVEIPVTGFAPLLDAIRDRGLNAKVRTGGVSREMFPEPEALLAFIEHACRENVPFKATAGLHHAVRGDYRLTYDEDSPKGPMFGFLNVFVTAAFVHAGMTDGAALALLLERDLKKIFVSSRTIRWGDRSVTTEEIHATRDCVAVSFGSCSFLEPVNELRAAALLP
ncbi:MAG TPA: hypothetical protein VGP95_13095 [Gemmatimonadaceae bacterium]|nr:hypothetical protein [Gemmatimonadaceae bacterium]